MLRCEIISKIWLVSKLPSRISGPKLTIRKFLALSMLQPRTARTLFVLINPSRSLERFTYLCAKEIQCSRQSSTASLPLKNNKQPYDPDDFVRKKFNTGAKKLSQLPKQIDYWGMSVKHSANAEVTIPPTRKGSPDLPPLWKAPQQHYEYFSLKWGLRGMNKTAYTAIGSQLTLKELTNST